MKNKIELKKYLGISIIFLIIAISIFFAINIKQYHKYNENYNNAINNIFSSVKEKYPEINEDEFIDIINDTSNDDNLYKYGISLENDSAIIKNNFDFKNNIILNLIILIISYCVFMSSFLIYNNKKDKKIKEITKYLEELNKKNYKLDISDNSEDELSILKNELYKTTVMLKETAENSLKDKENLKESLSNISHQLKTPITSILIMLDNIIDNENMDEETKKEFIKDIYREINNINFLVQAILKLSKFDANTIQFINKEENLKQVIIEAIKKIELISDLKNIKINIIGLDDININCDFKWQVEAITNILKNCVEHSYDNGEINIFLEETKLYAKVIIKDNGCGINQNDLKNIFKRFYKTKNSKKDSVGIGLSLSKTIIEKSNGFITVDSKENSGSSFTIKYFKN